MKTYSFYNIEYKNKNTQYFLRIKSLCKINLYVFISLFFGFVPVYSFSQELTCPFGEIDCLGKCGRYYDENGDGFCDYGVLSLVDTIKKIANTKKNTHSEIPQKIKNNIEIIETKDSLTTSNNNELENITESSKIVENLQKKNKPLYDLFLISISCFALYVLTFIMYKAKLFKKGFHNRFWNIILLISFLVSTILGIVLVVQLNYNIINSSYKEYLYWHVQFGIAMFAVGLLHISWHWRYFLRFFNKTKKQI